MEVSLVFYHQSKYRDKQVKYVQKDLNYISTDIELGYVKQGKCQVTYTTR